MFSALRRNNRIRDETQTALDGVDVVKCCLSYLVLSCLVLSCLVLSCPVLSCLVSCLWSCLVFLISYLLSLVSCLLSLVSCLLSLVSCLLSLVSCLLSLVSCLLSLVSCLLSLRSACLFAHKGSLCYVHFCPRPCSSTYRLSRALMPTLAVKPPHVCHRQRDWAVFIGTSRRSDPSV